jgi:hypothetical protein
MKVISVSVTGAAEVDGKIHYKVECILEDDGGRSEEDPLHRVTLFPLHVEKRFSDFRALQKQMSLAGCGDVGSLGGGLPRKTTGKGRGERVINARKVGLQSWLAAVVERYGDHGALFESLCTPPSPTVVPVKDKGKDRLPKGPKLPLRASVAANKFDVMISYSSLDRRIVRALADRLRDENLTVWFPVGETGKQSVANVRSSIDGAHVVLCCMRDEYVTAPHCMHEFEHLAAIRHDSSAKDGTAEPHVLSLIMQQGFQERATDSLRLLIGSDERCVFESWAGTCFDTVATALILEVKRLLLPLSPRASLMSEIAACDLAPAQSFPMKRAVSFRRDSILATDMETLGQARKFAAPTQAFSATDNDSAKLDHAHVGLGAAVAPAKIPALKDFLCDYSYWGCPYKGSYSAVSAHELSCVHQPSANKQLGSQLPSEPQQTMAQVVAEGVPPQHDQEGWFQLQVTSDNQLLVAGATAITCRIKASTVTELSSAIYTALGLEQQLVPGPLTVECFDQEFEDWLQLEEDGLLALQQMQRPVTTAAGTPQASLTSGLPVVRVSLFRPGYQFSE